MKPKTQLEAEIRAMFYEQMGYCASPRARARAAYLKRQEEKEAVEIARRVKAEEKLRNGEIK